MFLGRSLTCVRLPSTGLPDWRDWSWSKHPGDDLTLSWQLEPHLVYLVGKADQVFCYLEWPWSPRDCRHLEYRQTSSLWESRGIYSCAATVRRKHLSHQRWANCLPRIQGSWEDLEARSLCKT